MRSHPQLMITNFEAGLPNITGWWVSDLSGWFPSWGGCIDVDFDWPGNSGYGGEGSSDSRLKINASISSPFYGRSTTVQPSSVTMNFYIRAK